MAEKSTIEWTGSTWNPVTGCTKLSSGCKNCYAERMTLRLKAMGQKNYSNGFQVTTHPHVLNKPLQWKKPQTVFVNSMSDLFHKDVPTSFIHEVFEIMSQAEKHTFQILTKRSDRLKELARELSWKDNIWMGVSVENSDVTYRIDDLRTTGAKVKFLSMEPLLGSVPNLHLNNIDWVIVGGESGFGARPIKEEWVVEIKEQCLASGVPFFFKQWGGVRKKSNGRTLEGKIWDQMPETAMRQIS